MLVDDPQTVQEYKFKAAQHAVMHYRWEDVVRSHAAFYQRVINGRLLATLNDIKSNDHKLG
jgi:hypothetical protein